MSLTEVNLKIPKLVDRKKDMSEASRALGLPPFNAIIRLRRIKALELVSLRITV